jgi:membrane protein
MCPKPETPNPTVSAVESNRGREAETPSEIPPRGWRDIFLRVKDKVAADNLSIIAAGVAFYGFLAIFPAIAAVVSVFGLITSPAELQTYLNREPFAFASCAPDQQ